VINGRGFFQYSFGIIPRRQPITTVVGAPIEVNKKLKPTDKEIEDLHLKFIEKLRELFNTNKAKYSIDPNIQLIIQ